MSERRRFEVVPPDWGETHLTLEAVVAYVDGELAPGPQQRADRHLGRCVQCADEVVAQRQARTALRGADCPTLPSSLMSTLRNIPTSADLPLPPAGLAIGPDGEFVTVTGTGTGTGTAERSEGHPSGARAAINTEPVRRSRRMRIGAGAAFSGLALGALAFGATASGPGAATPTATSGTTPGAGAVANFAVSPTPAQRPGVPPSAPRPTMLNAKLPTDGR